MYGNAIIRKACIVNIKMNWVKGVFFASSMMVAMESMAGDQVGANVESVFAKVGKEVITWQDYQSKLTKEASAKFYHGQPAADVMAEFQRTVGNKMVTDALVLNEAKHRKLKPDSEVVGQEVSKVEQRYANDPQWAESKARVLPVITRQYTNENLVQKMEAVIRNVPAPTEAQLKAYFDKHPEKFTAPQEQRVSLILLRVDPSATPDAWKETMEDGRTLVKRIKDGADFSEMAKLYSKDEATVDAGGDMGYLHEGMLPGLPQEIISNLKVGEVSEPVRLLEGVAIFKLTERSKPGASSFESVKQRASELWRSEQSDAAWSTFLADLRKKTPVFVDESKFLPLAAGVGK